MILVLLRLFVSYLKIGFFGFGGGYAMLSLIHSEVVEQNGWLTNAEFADIVAVSQMTPGPIGINSATYVGYEVLAKSGASEIMSVLGSFTATFAVVLPSFIIVLLLCKVYETWKNHPIFKGVMAGLKPAVIGLIGTAAVALATPENFIDWKSFVICIVAFIALYFKKIGPFTAIGLGAVAGLILY